jgi:hypothetical protein
MPLAKRALDSAVATRSSAMRFTQPIAVSADISWLRERPQYNPALLAASMIDERAPDIVEALNDMLPELAVAVLLHLPPDRAIEVLDQPGLELEPELGMLMPREAAAKLLAGVSADRVADIFQQVKEPHCSELLDLLDPETRVNSAACWNIRRTPRDRS